ncbi:ABC transporter ATP-binding protein [Anaeromyxobacter paludicola]|uniref:Daunorubicin resistance protein DrrA family ABC transporter ATP-binding protein n=1 Tax=Anaeromyxobacter paludicola TaxID=2918171 RepID=A0ABM7X9E7_9BACT|nr:ABC transporter ATP-binding protein [Anaeromyxobacter paludicola]BDG08468.1 daunorubicin resistance protein DrrA family ABC transporter ATP-binding protein [Anaeromyxobacter paludicola]
MTAAAPRRPPAPAAPPRLAARALAFRYREREVLRGLSFEVGAGEIFGVLGPNGAGKSTLFSILTGLRAPDAGELLLDGAPVPFGDRALRARLGVVFQEPSLDAKLTCEENLVLGAALFAVPRAEGRARARALLERAGLAARAREPVSRLSGGMRRRLELARAVIHRPAILVLDEPTSGLDAAAFRATWEAIQALRREEGLTVLLNTHRPDEAEQCDRLAVMAEGRIVACEPPEALRSRVAGDVLQIEAADPEPLAREIALRFQVPARAVDGAVVVEREQGHVLVPRLVEAFPPGRFRSVSVRRPTLADAFLEITGRGLDAEVAP